MADRVAIITRDEDGVRIQVDGVILHSGSTIVLAESLIGLYLENTTARQREDKIRGVLNASEKYSEMLACDLRTSIRDILNEGIPF